MQTLTQLKPESFFVIVGESPSAIYKKGDDGRIYQMTGIDRRNAASLAPAGLFPPQTIVQRLDMQASFGGD